jgi:hypothetical protein
MVRNAMPQLACDALRNRWHVNRKLLDAPKETLPVALMWNGSVNLAACKTSDAAKFCILHFAVEKNHMMV